MQNACKHHSKMSKLLEKPEVARRVPPALLFFSLMPRLLGVELPIGDSFHIGEWFAAATTLWNDPTSSPLTIHGGWDFIPAIVTRWLTGGENYFYPTIYLTGAIIPAIAAAMLLLLLTRIMKGRITWPALIFLSIAAVAAPTLVGIRDLFLIATCWSLYELMTHSKSTGRRSLIILVIALLSAGVVWSFDRGIAGLVTVLTTLLSAAYFEKKFSYIRTAGLVVLCTALIIAIANTSGTIDYFYNVLFLAQTSSQWRYPLSPSFTANALSAIIFVAATIAATINTRLSEKRAYFHPYWLGISACALMMLRIGINRADMDHVTMAMWAPMILTAFSYSTREEPGNKPTFALAAAVSSIIAYFILYYAWFGIAFRILACSFSSSLLWCQQLGPGSRVRVFLASLSVWFLVLSLVNPTRSLASTTKSILKRRIVTPIEYLYKGVPYSRIADPGNAWAAKMIRDSGSKCLLDMTNSGIINAGANLPACIQASYPVYATKKFEDKLLREIENMDAKAVVYSSENWQYSIDSKDMKKRLPKVDALLRSRYPVEQCYEKYCIRSQQAMD